MAGMWDGWRRARARLGFGTTAQDLEPAEAYRLWSETYAEEINELQRLEADLRRQLVGELRGMRTLEVGSGTGRVTRDLLALGAVVLATDLVLEMLLRADTRTEMEGRVCVSRAEALPYRAASFDAVVCALTIGHVADLSSAVASMVGVLCSGGLLVVTGFHPEATLRGWKRTFVHAGGEHAIEQHAHDLDEFSRLLSDLGCPVEDLQERSWQGSSVLFGLRARKAPGKPAVRA